MMILRRLTPSPSTSTLKQALCLRYSLIHRVPCRSISISLTTSISHPKTLTFTLKQPRPQPQPQTPHRTYATSTSADTQMETLTELYATARDEFEIAAEETEKKSLYGPDDRVAAAEALQALKDAYDKVLRESSPEVAKDVQTRVGARIRELENAVKAMEEMAMED